MNPVGFFRACWIVAAKDLRIEWRTWDTLSAGLIFSLTVLLLFNFAFGIGTVQDLGPERLVPGVLWSVLLFASIVGMARSLQIEQLHDTMSALFMAPADRGALFAGKALANLVKLTTLQWILLPLTAVFFNYNLFDALLPLVFVLFIHGIGLTELGTLFAAVTAKVGRGEALLATLLFPAATPLLISAARSTAIVLEGQPLSSASNWLLLTLGFDVLYFLVALITFEFVMEE